MGYYEMNCSCGSGFYINNAGVALLSLLFIVMFIAICCLSYFLYRQRRNKYQETKILPSEVTQSEFIRQISNDGQERQETVTLKKICQFDSPFKNSGILTMVDADKAIVNTENKKPETPKIVKRDYTKSCNGTKLTMQPVITPDQMTKVCDEVLSKIRRNQTTSLTHLNELMKSKHNEDTNGEQSKFEDNFEEYDVLPKPRKLTSSDGDDMDVYDCPPMVSKSTESIDSQRHYDNLSIREDVYQNARLIQGRM